MPKSHAQVQKKGGRKGGGTSPSNRIGRHVTIKWHLIANESGWFAQLCVQVFDFC